MKTYGAIFEVYVSRPYGEGFTFGHFSTEQAATDCVQVLYSEAVIAALTGSENFIVCRLARDVANRPTFETFEIEHHDDMTELCENGPEADLGTALYGVLRIDVSDTVGQWADNRPAWMTVGER